MHNDYIYIKNRYTMIFGNHTLKINPVHNLLNTLNYIFDDKCKKNILNIYTFINYHLIFLAHKVSKLLTVIKLSSHVLIYNLDTYNGSSLHIL